MKTKIYYYIKLKLRMLSDKQSLYQGNDCYLKYTHSTHFLKFIGPTENSLISNYRSVLKVFAVLYSTVTSFFQGLYIKTIM